MNTQILEILLQLSLFFALCYATFVFLTLFSDAVEEFREGQVRQGDVGLAELYVGISPELFFVIRCAIAALLFSLGFYFINSIFGAIFAVAGFLAPKWTMDHLRYKRVRKVETQLVEGLELLGNSLKSGLTLPQAVELLVRELPAPLSQEFSLVLAETRLGVDFIEALSNMATRLNSNIVGILASGVAVTKRCGGDLTVIFTNIAQTIREQATIEGKLDAVTAQARFQGLILSVMPFALVVVLYFIDRSHVETLFGYQLGLWGFFAVIVMVVLAQLWIRKLLAIDV